MLVLFAIAASAAGGTVLVGLAVVGGVVGAVVGSLVGVALGAHYDDDAAGFVDVPADDAAVAVIAYGELSGERSNCGALLRQSGARLFLDPTTLLLACGLAGRSSRGGSASPVATGRSVPVAT